MPNKRVNFESLKQEYLDPNNLQYKKLIVVDQYIPKSISLLDIGAGTGEFINLESNKFVEIYGVDVDLESLNIYKEISKNENCIHFIESNLTNLNSIFSNNKFDCVICLDVLEHTQLQECLKVLQSIYNITKDNGLFIFTGPGILEKFQIFMRMSPTHLYSHFSYGWKKLIEEAGFKVLSVETVEFPFINYNFLIKNVHIFGKCCIIVSQKLSW
jgi:ubiquinone/menaquinone biosynthesis C-methylase UbiE